MWLDNTLALLSVDFVQQSLIAAMLLGLLSGIIAPLIVLRNMSFSVHATSELALMGAAAALLFSFNVGIGAILGAVVAAIVLGLLGLKNQDSTVGVVMSFGLGLSVLFIHLYPGNSRSAFSLLTGQIVGVRETSVWILAGITALVIITLALVWRPLLFISADPVLATALGVNIRGYSLLFAVLVGLTASQSVQIVGALLVMALLITPGAAAIQVASSPLRILALSVSIAFFSAVGGLVLSLAPGLPVSVMVVSLSFGIYLICRFLGWRKSRQTTRDDAAARRIGAYRMKEN